MHVAFWSPGWPLEKFQNGIVTYVHWMKLELERLGHKVSVFTGDTEYRYGQNGVYRVHSRSGLWQNLVRRLGGQNNLAAFDVFQFSTNIADASAEVHRRCPIDIIDMEESFGWFADIEARTSIPTLPRLHGPAFLSLVQEEIQSPFNQRKIDLEGRALRRAIAVTSPSTLTLKQTVARYKLTTFNGHVIANPIHLDSRTPVWMLEHCERDTILFVGRIDLRKGADIVLNAFQLLSNERPELHLIIVGPDRGIVTIDGATLKYLDYCNKFYPNGFANRVTYLGPRGNQEITTLRTRAMTTIIASRWENQGYTLLEAMSQGCPIVSSDAGGNPECIEDGITGRIARSEDPADFARQIGSLLDDPQGAASFGAAAKRTIAERHSVTKIARDSLQVYEQLATKRRNIG